MERIKTYNLTEDFIDSLASFVEDRFLKKGADISRLAFVFGGKRPSLFLKRELSRRIKQGFMAPRFFAMNEFVGYALEKKERYASMADLDACFALYTLAKKIAPDILKGRASFSQFLPWAQEILRFIDQLDLEDIALKSLKDIQLHAQIGFDVPENINVLLEHIIALRDAFHGIAGEKQAYPRGLIYSLASRHIPELSWDEFDGIFFCNFFYLHRTEEKIIKSLYDSGKAFLIFQGGKREWPILEKASANLCVDIEPERKGKPGYQLFLHEAFDLHSQVCTVREILKKIKNHDKTVVVLPEPDHLVPLLSEITSCTEVFNISLGYSLKRSSVYSLFDCIFKAQETSKDGEYYTKDFLRVLSHPLVKNLKFAESPSVTRILVHKIEEILVGIEKTSLGGSLFIKPADLLELPDLFELALEANKRMDVPVSAEILKKIMGELCDFLFYCWEDVVDFNTFATRLERFLELLIRKGFLSRYPLDLKIAERIFAIQQELKDSVFASQVFPREEIFRIFKSKLENEAISFSGSPLKGLQILGLLESRSLSFENVIVMDANESLLPKLKVCEPLIPREVMMALGINQLEKEEEIQRYQFLRLMSSAKNVHLIYQEGEDKQKSRFIEELIWEKEKESLELGILSSQRMNFKVGVFSKAIAVKKQDHEIPFLTNYKYSASSVNTYLHCPLRFYYQYVLGLQETEVLWEEPEAVDVGNFVHALLEKTFSLFVGHKPSIDQKFRDYFLAEFDKKFQNEFRRKMKSDAFLVKEILEFRLRKFLDYEGARDIKEILCVEKPMETAIPLAGRQMNFKCRIDRIDRLRDESLLVLDYKTGGSDLAPAGYERLESLELSRQTIKKYVKSFQLPLYLHFVKTETGEPAINAAFYNLRNIGKDYGLKKFFAQDDDPDQRERMMAFFMKALGFIVTEILDPNLPFAADQEDAHYCKNCPFFYLCR